MKYRRLPVEIEAIQFDYEKWLYERRSAYPMVRCGQGAKDGFGSHGIYPYIKTLESKHRVSDKDYIIQEITGEFYPLQADIFEKTYELVE